MFLKTITGRLVTSKLKILVNSNFFSNGYYKNSVFFWLIFFPATEKNNF
jgi:hypothetical protein